MNKKQIEQNRLNSLELIKRSSRYGTRVGCAKCWSGITKNHWEVTCSIVWKLINEYKFIVITEAEFIGKNGGRADIFYIDNQGNPGVIEILNTESDKYFNTKLERYELPITKIRVEDYNEDWCL